MRLKFLIIFVLIFFLTQCFSGIDKQGSVTGYAHGVVKTKGGSFRVGELPHAWKKQPIKFRAILFENQNDHATITIDSWCQRAADDRSLEVLTQQLFWFDLGLPSERIPHLNNPCDAAAHPGCGGTDIVIVFDPHVCRGGCDGP